MKKQNETVIIDGSYGEGGGQVLRTALSLSLVTGRPFKIEKIRAGRSKSGLMRQHLTAVNAAVELSDARVLGNSVGSRELYFEPGGIKPGQYHFAVGTAGSSTLVLQTVLPALITAGEPSGLVLEGGTHNPFAPPFDFLARAFIPVLNRLGARVSVHLERPGFYPAGGGRFNVRIEPGPGLAPIDLLERGMVVNKSARAIVSRLPGKIAQRELAVVGRELGWEKSELKTEVVDKPLGPGNILVVEIESENIIEVFTGFGAKGVSAETVAQRAVEEVRYYLHAGPPVAGHLADQILLPMVLAGGGSFRTLPLTNHTLTNIEVIKKFIDVSIEVAETGKDERRVRIKT